MAYSNLTDSELWEGMGANSKAIADIARYQLGIAKGRIDPIMQAKLTRSDMKSLAKLQRDVGRPADAAATARERANLWPGHAIHQYNVACELALCIPLVQQGEGAPTKKEALRQQLGDEAVEAFRRSMLAGYADAAHVKTDTRVQPKAEEAMILNPDVRMICDVGGVYLFSAAHMHSTVPNTSGVVRYSIDFRTIHLDDVWAGVGAHNVDSACTGTSMRDFLRATDLVQIPDQAMGLYDR